MKNKIKRSILIYLISFYCVSGLLFLKLNSIRNKNFNDKNFEEIVMTTSKFRGKTDDLCTSRIFGDPINVEENYVKFEFDCGSNKVYSTMAIKSVKDMRFRSILDEYLRVLNFNYETWQDQNWKCFIGEREINEDEMIGKTNTISCFKK